MTDKRIFIQNNRERPILSADIKEHSFFQDLQTLNELLRLEPQQINIQSDCYNKAIKHFINKAINCGCTINFEIEKHNYIFQEVNNLKPIFWRFKAYEEMKGFSEIKEIEKSDYFLSELECFAKIDYREKISGSKIEITEEMIDTLRKYGQAYGIDTYYINSIENPTKDSPENYKPFYYKVLNGNNKPNHEEQKLIFIRQKAKKNFIDKKRVLDDFQQVQWYINNKIPYDDGWTDCPTCGTPAKNGYCRLCNENEPEQLTYKQQFIIDELLK